MYFLTIIQLFVHILGMFSENRLVNFAIIAPRNQSRMFSIQHIVPVVNYAIEEIHNGSLLPNFNISVHFGDSKCDSTMAPLQAFDFYMEGKVSVFLGPMCDYSLAPVARYAPYWNLPVISPGGFAHDFGANKSAPEAEYSTLTRTGVTFNSLALFAISMFNFFNFSTAKVIYDQSGNSDITPKFCFLAASAIVYYSKEKKIDYSFHIYLPDVHDIKDMLKSEIGDEFGRKYQRIAQEIKIVPFNFCKGIVNACNGLVNVLYSL